MTHTGAHDVAQTLLDTWLADQQRALGVAGLSAGILLPDGELLTAAHGLADRERGTPMTVEAPLRMASITKMFTVTALLIARDRGLLSFDTPAAELVPELASAVSPAAAPAPITLRQLVSHTAGVPTNLPQGVEYWSPPSSEKEVAFPPSGEARAWLRDMRLVNVPMTDFHYSNIGFMIAGLALEAAFGQPYEELLREHVLTPLGMDEAFFGSAAELDRVPQGYRPDRGEDLPAPRMVVGWDTAGGGLCCSGPQLARFMRLHLSDLPAGGAQVLGGSSIREARQPVFELPGEGNGVGLGWWRRRVDGQAVVMHSGNMAGYDACMMLAPALGVGAYLLTNTNRVYSSTVLRDLLTAVMAVVRNGPEQLRYERTPPPPDAERVTGRYSTPEWDYDVIAVGGGYAMVMIGDLQHVARLEPTDEPGHFVGSDGFAAGEPVRFGELRDGRYTEVALQGQLLRRS